MCQCGSRDAVKETSTASVTFFILVAAYLVKGLLLIPKAQNSFLVCAFQKKTFQKQLILVFAG